MTARGRTALLLPLLLTVALAGCRTGRNYADPDATRAAGARAMSDTTRGAPDTLRVVSFNIAFARRLDAAIALLATHPALRGADVVLLQEMTGDATRRVARALDLHWVYYPAIHHTRARQDFGNAVLSRWPIVEDARLVLPHPSRYAGTQRIATAATIRVGDTLVRVYSTHLGTPLDVGARSRRAQMRAILADAARHPRVILGGDLNDGAVGRVARDAGYAWPTERGPRTTRFGRWDHVFLRGLASPARDAAGTVGREARGISDHVPVWARAVLR
ncbi:endonuclease/exonuclease/phosphatase family protein [Roseisolibacter agri]|uniref:Endonuclease/exonuclease/phosphatase domain-containing protein n=1 Tax=Roseisolibacter agri TaxID=2014610 RepID=A0AA37V1C0_9BACT|nr:endonuclease/exonuclease/phosphatase family protein [Roseisolibacter agri]GLC23532.1 hypothetical protein rosag_00450 [Roseisolibacter agri]